jgi:hypothetical protein
VVVDTTALAYSTKRDYDAATSIRIPNTEDVLRASILLDSARHSARVAQREFDQHVHEHHCKV